MSYRDIRIPLIPPSSNLVLFLAFSLLIVVTPTSMASDTSSSAALELPWRQAGLDERQAAAHLLDRLAFGARLGDIDTVVDIGLETWLLRQLDGDFLDASIDKELVRYKSLHMSTQELVKRYPSRSNVIRRAVAAGIIEPPGAVEDMPAGRSSVEDVPAGRSEDKGPVRGADRQKIMRWAESQGIGSERRALGELMVRKIGRGLYAENQLHEVLTDFWFNHFNVSTTDNQARIYVQTYERDAIRPHVLGSFRDMLGATAHHPAMLAYLDNAGSAAEAGQPTTFDRNAQRRRGRGAQRGSSERRAPPTGLNENYARELMELHTLGVDGGYSQTDVVEVARAFTGWKAYPPDEKRPDVARRLQQAKSMPNAGFVFEPPFLFRADIHDAAAKSVLGQRLKPGRGIEDGEQVLDILAGHPSTARHLAQKLAVRFVSDAPPEDLVMRLAVCFERTDGDLRAVMSALVTSPEFWAMEARQAKIKSPFELAMSALRVTGAEVFDPRGVMQWLARLGQPLYAHQAPTGYPDRADAWVNTGALLNRMNFGLQLATGRISGVRIDVGAMTRSREPESLDEALAVYTSLLLPERDVESTVARLELVVRDPDLLSKIDDAAPGREPSDAMEDDEWDLSVRTRGRQPPPPMQVDDSPVAQVVGVILGSPDFQRR